MKQIKNLHLLPQSFSPDAIEKMEYAATEHRRHNGIVFKIIEYNAKTKKVVIQIRQEKNAAGVYHNKKRLLEIVPETFGRFFPGIKISVQPIPYQESPVNKIDIAWVKDKMLTTGTKLKDIEADTGLNYTYLSSLINGNEPLGQSMKAMFFYYFMSKNL